jgi:NAD(P)-dependent dehydrogenase (short-subunit alcohol dehydrogenase family)
MGLATAQAEGGAAVVLADVNEDALRAATEALTAARPKALGILCDVSSEDQVAAMVDRAVAAFGRLDMAFNNAGIQAPPTDAADEPAETFDRVNTINLRGVWACMKHELRQMRTKAAAPSSTAPPSAGSSDCPVALLSRRKARGDRPHPQRRPGIRATRDPDQRRLPGHHRNTHGHRHDRQG